MVRGLVALLVAAVWAGAGPGAVRPAAAATVTTAWSWPVPGVVTRPFAPPAQRWGAGHRGVDLLTAPGVPVRAAGAGRVSYAGLLAGRGVLVVVHGALRTTYEPVAASVGLGQKVDGGEVIGTVEPGHAGCPVLACLHWGLRRGEEYLDPLRLVEPGPVRLLPLTGVGPGASPSHGSTGDEPAGAGPAAGGVGAGGPAVVAAARPAASAGSRSGAPGGGAPAPAPGPALAALGAGAVLAGAALRRRA